MNMESVKQMVHNTLNDESYKKIDSNRKSERSSPNSFRSKEENVSLQADGIPKIVTTPDCNGDYTASVKERSVTFSPHINDDVRNNENFFERNIDNKSSNYR